MVNLPLLHPVRITEEVLKTLQSGKDYTLISENGGEQRASFSDHMNTFWIKHGLIPKRLIFKFDENWSVYLPLPEGREKEEMAKMIFNNIQGHSDSIALNIIEQHLDEYLASNIQKGGECNNNVYNNGYCTKCGESVHTHKK